MFVEEHRDQPAAEDDFEWVNAWAASAREGKNPRAAVASENAPQAPVSAVTLIEAPPLAEPVLAADSAAPAPEPVVDTAVPQLPASSLDGIVPEPSARFEDEGAGEVDSATRPNADVDASIPQSTEVMPLPETPVQVRPPRRAPWTSLFRLVSGDAGRLPRDLGAEHPVATHETVQLDAPTPGAIASELVDQAHETVQLDAATPDAIPSEPADQTHETVRLDAPTPFAIPSEPADQQCDADVALTPDQLERDIAEIELVRDQLLSELEPAASLAAPEPSLLSRTSDMVPILVGGALGFILLVVFGAAASFVSLR
jgi:hypothetical protein